MKEIVPSDKEKGPISFFNHTSEMKEIVLSNDSVIYLEDWVQDLEVIPLESLGNVLVGSIDGVIVTDEHIVIYDQRQTHSVFIFDRNGKHRTTINRRGRGPQEYASLGHVTLLPDNKTLVVSDRNGGKVLYFTTDGRFISDTQAKFWFNSMEYVDENSVIFATYGAGEQDPGLQEYENRTDLLYFTDNKFGIKSSTMPPRYRRNQIVITPTIRKFGEQVYVHRPYSDTIYQALSDGLKAAYRVDMEKIDGIANLNPDITFDEFKLLQEKNVVFHGGFTDSDNYLNLSLPTLPHQYLNDYLYSKRTQKGYRVENKGSSDHVIFWFLNLPQTSFGDRFVTVVNAYRLMTTGSFNSETGVQKTAAVQRPELASLTENSNPVVIFYSFKEGL